MLNNVVFIWHWLYGDADDDDFVDEDEDDVDDGTMNVISVRASVNFRTNFSPLNAPPPLSHSTAGNSGSQETINQILGVTSGERFVN